MYSDSLTRVLGIDFGEKRIGIAVSDPTKSFASTLVTLQNNSSLIDEILKIIKIQQVDKIILGLPDEKNLSNQKILELIRSFKAKIEKATGLPVIFWNEEFTSVIAKEKILQSVNKKSKRRDKGLIDRTSAAIILQEYLDSVK